MNPLYKYPKPELKKFLDYMVPNLKRAIKKQWCCWMHELWSNQIRLAEKLMAQ